MAIVRRSSAVPDHSYGLPMYRDLDQPASVTPVARADLGQGSFTGRLAPINQRVAEKVSGSTIKTRTYNLLVNSPA
jgi:hypothetical protein